MGRLLDIIKTRPMIFPRGPIREMLLNLFSGITGKLPSFGSAHNAEEWSIQYDPEGNIAKILVNRNVSRS